MRLTGAVQNAVTGAVQNAAVANSNGRISFEVNLGRAHQAEQYTAPAAQETFVTRRVNFTPQPSLARAGRRSIKRVSRTAPR